ncbi:hypothetical protein Taci_1049 [Thermanaerovibrio acidaminovorans DSM 6589]|uniref:Type 4 fimbrial biogenesis protein PilX N-terminal domain-containing protein n=1 Tax=Thermanaerovibrio acidaminovorans (strain ATCC 49978 / DSM 6589 / Su883) TaxID=525903 RepID=D1B5J0_THEAS|nr:type II secretion system protein [Thermanaerovibrio acidaminovorans]ACZ19281.1 hypothetical protein Taci_1049 [Thermanaerovibrio acidaminovorans DSM 6589]
MMRFRRGFALPTVLVIMLVSLGLVATTFFISSNLFSTTQSVVQQKRHYISAQYGVSLGEAWLVANTSGDVFPGFDPGADLSPSGILADRDIDGMSVPFGNLIARSSSGSPGVLKASLDGGEVTVFIYRVDYDQIPSYRKDLPPRLKSIVEVRTSDITIEPSLPGSSGGVGVLGDAGIFRPPSYVIRSVSKRKGFALGEDRYMVVEEGVLGRSDSP